MIKPRIYRNLHREVTKGKELKLRILCDFAVKINNLKPA